MDDDDEFGDLYTDVLRPFQPSSEYQSRPAQVQPKQQSPNRPIDLNVESDDEEILYGAPNSNPKFNLISSHKNQAIVFKSEKATPEPGLAGSCDSRRDFNLGVKQQDQEVEKEEGLAAGESNWARRDFNLGVKQQDQEVENEEGLAEGESNWASDLPEPSLSRVLESGGYVKLQGKRFEDPNLIYESGIDVVVEERDDKDDELVGKDQGSMDKKENFEKFDIEEVDTGIGDMGSEPVIPGLSFPRVSDAVDNRVNANFAMRDEASEGDDWDSDSEDDLQIVLNDNNHGPMVMASTGVVGSDDEDEDGNPLVIVGDSEPGHQPMEEQEWGDDAAQAVDGERKELGDAAKVNGGVAAAPKIGYSNLAYHPYHSQFKYVRPGATPMPGAGPVGPVGAPGQIRPPVNMGPVAGRGRGDWRPTGIKSASPMQKSFHPGFGMPVWGNNTAGRGFGSGMEFTLPSHK